MAVEARSLSSLTTLASNPPSYPRNPTHVKHDPLVLYIARVPGSRDVFLSPMKPRDKVVTAEDIQSSLYYVHIDQPEDACLLAPPQDVGFPEPCLSPPNQLLVQPIQQKANPATLAPSRMAATPQRKPVPGMRLSTSENDGQRNIGPADFSQILPGHSHFHQRLSVDSNKYQRDVEPPAPPLPPRRHSKNTASIGTFLTLIRRDPASSAQWNVACIEDPPLLDVSSSNLKDSVAKKKAGSPLCIEINTPGYSKFLNPPETNPISTQSGNEQFYCENIFRRRLWMEGARHSNGGFGHRKNNSYDSGMGRYTPRASYESQQRGRPFTDPHHPETPPTLTRDDQPYNAVQVSDRQSSFRGYVFMSPWNGRCEFITGAGGGSLKCRHVVPGPQGSVPISMPVSELRFNLPSTSRTSASEGNDTPKRSSLFHRSRPSLDSSLISGSRTSVDDVRNSLNRLDLSLGQEFAGGGFGGKQAKLGKLIIEDEGFKMVDLLVAANIALWWRAYEKVS
ncbi:hypothetical protein CC78DRAFT_529893 [Lojkania enalia]|uniref:Oxidoreductase-like protein n=1 Tax=Lojkania enalia TaxID=147567 RepID=A0A9P4KH20_9PLEO|nr:hypothetical protein CC78DRAFT_529893 [Didymosphaeria enalia]